MQLDDRVDLVVYPGLDELSQASLEFFCDCAADAIKEKGVFFAAISGGTTPGRFFELLSVSELSRSLQWEKIHLFWVDERYVSAESEMSNYKLASDTFLSKLDIPEKNVHRIQTEYEDIEIAEQIYEAELRESFNLTGDQVPVFDIIVLGMGADGHTASLLPGSFATFDESSMVSIIYVMDDKQSRITLTPRVLKNAAKLLVLVNGREKAQTLKEVLTIEPDEVRYPIHILWPALKKMKWLADEQAAEKINTG